MRVASTGGLKLARTIAFAVIVVLSLALAGGAWAWVVPDLGGAVAPRTADRPAYNPTTVTVKFRPGVSLARIDGVAAAMGGKIARASLYTPGLREITIPTGADLRAVIAGYRQRLDVEYAEPTYLDYPAFVPNDPRYGEQWHFPMIHLPEAWDQYPARGSASVVVAVIDTGVAFENFSTFLQAPDLAGGTFVNPKDIVDGDTHPNDEVGHGTHVTGTIAQRTNNSLGVAGVADGVSIMPIRTLGPGGGSHAQFSDGVHWAVDNGAKVINYSASGGDSTTKHDAVIYAYNADVLFVAAYGNDASNNPGTAFPGRYPEAMGVGAIDRGKALAYYSNWGDGVDVVAPGGETNVNQADGVLQNTFAVDDDPSSFDYRFFMGTSMATPHVTGLAALLFSQGTYGTRQAVFDRITGTCEDLGAAGYDTTFGWGLINASAALPGLPGTPPVLTWAGTRGYTADGVSPDEGSETTKFTFKVKVTDANGSTITTAKVRLDYLLCNGLWAYYKELAMTPGLGDIMKGVIYSATTTLPNRVWRYRFIFADKDGAATGLPTKSQYGPRIVGVPFLCWLGTKGYEKDGVNPNTGPGGTSFVFAVKYRDSAGNAPTTATVELRLNGRAFGTLKLSALRGGSYTIGKVFQAKTTLSKTGKYSYRFQCSDASGLATGAPANWTAGPTVGGVIAAGMVTSVAAVPSATGAQITLNLSQAAVATATVYNIAGRPVRLLALEQPLAAGPNTLLWDRRSDAGLSVPAGIYLIRVEAQSENGASSSALATLSLR